MIHLFVDKSLRKHFRILSQDGFYKLACQREYKNFDFCILFDVKMLQNEKVFYHSCSNICRYILKNLFVAKTVSIGSYESYPAAWKTFRLWIGCWLFDFWCLMVESLSDFEIAFEIGCRSGKWKTGISFCNSLRLASWTSFNDNFCERAFGKQRISPINKIKSLESIIVVIFRRTYCQPNFGG